MRRTRGSDKVTSEPPRNTIRSVTERREPLHSLVDPEPPVVEGEAEWNTEGGSTDLPSFYVCAEIARCGTMET